jgi:hypothetical protein
MTSSISTPAIPRRQMWFLVGFLILSGTIGILLTIAKFKLFWASAPLIQVWTLYVLGAAHFGMLISAGFIYDYKKFGLVIGIASLSFILCDTVYSLSDFLYRAQILEPDDKVLKILLLFTLGQIMIMLGCLILMARFLMVRKVRDYFF